MGSPLLYGAKQPARISPRTGATRTLWSRKAGAALPGRHEQHHRTAEFIPHDFRIGFQKARFRLRLHKFQQFESVLEKSVDVGRQGFVILHDLFAEETGLADALGKIAVHGPVEMIPLRVAMPFLRSLRGEYRMLHGKDEVPSGGEAAVHLGAQAAERLDIVEGERAYRHIERVRREIDSFNRHTQVLDGG